MGEVVSAGDAGGLDQLVLLLAGLTLVLAVTTFAQTWALGVMGERIVARLRGQVFDRLVSLELDFYTRRRVGELISRLSSDVTQVRTMLTQTLTSLLSSVLSLIGAIAILLPAQPIAAHHHPGPGAGPRHRGHGLRAPPAAAQHASPGRHRRQHDHR